MANVKNFGLVGVGSDLQFGKTGTRLINNAGTFNFKGSNGTTDAALTAAGITSSAGNVTLTTGNLVLSANAGTISIGDASLVRNSAGVLQASGTSAFMVPVGSTAQQPTGATGMVRVNNDATPVLEFYNGTVWSTLSDSGSLAALQTEVNNIEASLGSSINTDGTFNGAAFTGAAFSSPTSVTNAIQQVADYAISKDTLDEIFPQTGAGNVIYSDGSNWQQAVPGATSGVQGYDADLAAIAALATTGISVRTGSGTWATRSLVQPAEGLTISNADGVAGNPTFALANDLAALEGLTTTGYIVRTGDGTATTRSVTGTATRIVVTNGDGVASDTNVDLATVSQANTGNFVKVTLDGYGRVTGNTAVVAGDITSLVDTTYLRLDGTNSMGADLNAGGFKVTNVAEPTLSTDAATKNYVDNAITGLSWKQAVHVVSITNVPLTGGATLTIDSHALNNGDRVLLTNQTDPYEDGIYDVSGIGTAYTLTRSSDADTFQELNGAAVFVQQGTVYADTGWVQTATLTSLTTGATQVWVQFSGAGSYTGGTGIDVTGNVISAKLGAGIASVPTGEIGIDLFDPASGGLILTTDGTTRSTNTAATLTLLLDSTATGGLDQNTNGLFIKASGVTNAMLANSTVGLNADAGTSTLALGQTLLIAGTSTQGINTSVSGQTVTVTAADASASQKGVATFNTASFTVTAGDVTIKNAGVSNAQLANSTITMAGDTGSDAVALGETFTFVGDSTYITTTVGANNVTFGLGTVDVPHGGTGQTSFTTGQILFGNSTSPIATSSDFVFTPGTPVDTLSIGGATGLTLTTNDTTHDVTLTAVGTNGDIVLLPDGTGSVIVGPVGAGLIQSDVGTALTVRGNNGLTLESGTAGQDVVMLLPTGTTTKVSVSGPTASDYATGLAANDLTNKQYVDNAIATGASAGAIKAVSATVDLSSAGTTNIGAVLPAGSTVLSVKVNVTAADTGTGTLSVGISGGVSDYMTTAENDTQTIGLYLAECMVTNSGVQVIATVAGTPAGTGSAKVVVEYQVAE